MEISALHNAILKSPLPPRRNGAKRAVQFSDVMNSGESVSDSSTSFIDEDINIFDPLPRPAPPLASPIVSSTSLMTSDLLPPAAAVGRRDSLEIRYHLEDETKRHLTQSNQELKQQMEELRKENERLQRQMAVQNKEHRYAQAQWNDKVLDLQVELDSTKLEKRRIKEAQEDAELERELEHLKSQLDEDDYSENDDTGDATTQQQPPANSTQDTISAEENLHFATIPSRSLPNGDSNVRTKASTNPSEAHILEHQQMTIEELISQQAKQKEQWESEKSELYSLMQKMIDQVDDSRIRVEWLERELIAMCPSDTDDDEEKKIENGTNKEEDNDGEDNDSDSTSDASEASTKKTGKSTDTKQPIFRGTAKDSTNAESLLAENPPKQILVQRIREALDSYVQIQGRQSRKIQKLTNQLKLLEKEKEMDEGMQYQQIAEMKQKIGYYQHRLQQTQKTLEFQEVSRDEFHNEWTGRIEELELENLRVSQQASKWEEQCARQTGLLKRQLSSLQEELDQSKLIIERLKKEKAEASAAVESKKQDWFFGRNKTVDALKSELKQSNERETMLEEQLNDQNAKLKVKEEALGKAQERIQVLMAYAEMDESNGEESPKAR